MFATEEQVVTHVKHVVTTNRNQAREALTELSDQPLGKARQAEYGATHPAAHQNPHMLGRRHSALDKQPDNLEDSADNAAAYEGASANCESGKRIGRRNDSLIRRRCPTEHSGNVTTGNAHNCANGIKPYDQPRTRPY